MPSVSLPAQTPVWVLAGVMLQPEASTAAAGECSCGAEPESCQQNCFSVLSTALSLLL